MKHILFLLLFLCPALAFAQWPAAPNKMRLGNQTTGDGLVVRTASSPGWTPSTVNNAWLAFDTVAGVFYYYDAAVWNAFAPDNTTANNGLTMSGDTVQLGGALTKNTEINTDGKTFRVRDAGAYPDLFINSNYGLLSSDINTYLDVGSTSGRARIVASTTAQLTSAANTDVSATDTVTITGQRIRLNAADTRIQQVAKDNALNRVMMLDSLTGQVKYRDVSSIAGGGGGADLSFSGTSSPVTLNSSTGADVTFTAGTGVTLSATGTNTTITNSAPDQTVAITGAGINVASGAYPNFTITGTEVDGSVSNEGSLTVGAGTATTAIINSNTSGSTGVTLEVAGTGLAISESGNTITLTGSGGGVTGTGTTNTIAKWTSSTALGNSLFTDDGTNSVAGGTASFRLPNGTTAQRPGAPTAGMTRYNTTLGYSEIYGASAWLQSNFPTGTTHHTLRYDGTSWSSTSILQVTGSFVGINSPTNLANNLQVAGTIGVGNLGSARFEACTPWDGVAAIGGSGMLFQTGNTADYGFWFTGNRNGVVGNGFFKLSGNFTAASGAGYYAPIDIIGTINQSGTASGYSCAIKATHTLTNAVDYRGYYITANSGKSFFADGTAENVFRGNTMIGASTSPSRTLHVTGEARITDLTTDAPTRIVGADADGDLGQMTLGGNLTIAAGILSADNTNLTLADEGNGVRIQSSTGTDVDLLEDSGVYITRSGNAAYFGKYLAYGEASITGSQTLTFAGGSTAYDTLSGYTEQAVDGFVLQGGALKYTGTRTIQVRVQVSISLTFAEAADVLAGIRQNTTSITKSRARQKIATAGDINNISLTCLLTLAPDDLIRIELAPSAHTGDDDITVYHCNFNISEL